MTSLAHNAAMLRVPISLESLWTAEQTFVEWAAMVVDRVMVTRREQAADVAELEDA